jgi:hypothetical protein
VLEGGNDWQTICIDGATTLDVRLALKTVDEALIGITHRGIRHGPADVVASVERGEVVDPALSYFRANPQFETASTKYGWINRILAIGIGHRSALRSRLQHLLSALIMSRPIGRRSSVEACG